MKFTEKRQNALSAFNKWLSQEQMETDLLDAAQTKFDLFLHAETIRDALQYQSTEALREIITAVKNQIKLYAYTSADIDPEDSKLHAIWAGTLEKALESAGKENVKCPHVWDHLHGMDKNNEYRCHKCGEKK